MKTVFKVVAISALAFVAACDDKKEENNQPPAPASQEQPAAQSGAVDKLKNDAMKMVESVKLDTSSFEAFQASLGAMKTSLSDADKARLSDTLATMAKDAAGGEDGAMDAVKGMASGKSADETLYETLKGKLNGMSFDDIMAAGN